MGLTQRFRVRFVGGHGFRIEYRAAKTAKWIAMALANQFPEAAKTMEALQRDYVGKMRERQTQSRLILL